MPLRVGVVSGAFRPHQDGVADYTARLVRQLASIGVQPFVLSTDAAETDAGVPVECVGARWDAAAVRRAARSARRMRLDLVHVQFAPSAYGYRPAIGLLPLALRGTAPLVVTLHEYGWWAWRPRLVPASVAAGAAAWAERRGWWDRETLRLTVAAARLLVTNETHARTVRSRVPASAARVRTVPIAPNVDVAVVDRDEARADLRRRLRAPAGAPVLVFFGFVHPVKGVGYLLDAVAGLHPDRPGLRLVLAGAFESLALPGEEARSYRAEVERAVRDRGLEGAVRLTGWLPELQVSRLLQAADVAVLPFTAGVTTKSGSLLAALAHGLPTVAAVAEPADPRLVDGDGALLVPPRDPDALAAAVAAVLDDAALARRLAAGGRRVAARHAWPAIAAAHRDIYRTARADRP